MKFDRVAVPVLWLASLLAIVAMTGALALTTPNTGLSIEQQMDATVALINPSTNEVHCTGVVIARDRVLTAKHCVNPVADDAPVKFRDGYVTMGKVIARGEFTDVALIEVNTGSAPIAHDASNEFVGDRVCAVGMPMGFFEWSYTCGVISALRPAGVPEFEQFGKYPMIQTDAPGVNGGNSGGPLFDARGHLIGIASWGVKIQYGSGIHLYVPMFVARLALGI
jgi:S1-C subfamily serine protease